MNLLKKIMGDETSRFLKRAARIVNQVNALEPTLENLSVEELRAKTAEFQKRLAEGTALDDILPEAFAVGREAARRSLGQRPYDAQLVGGLALHEGKVAEMKTGEGKTLAATLPVYLNALLGKGVHVVTVNDYLARRDTVWMGQIYDFLGLTVACLNHESAYRYDSSFKDQSSDEERDAVGGFKVVHEFLRPVPRNEAYRADITYGTNNEFGFDYLRDNLVLTPEQVSQRQEKEGGWNYAIVDEVDSILVDEARTPLIISQPDEESGKLYQQFARIVPKLKPQEHYELDEKRRAVTLTEQGINKVEELLGGANLYEEGGVRFVHHLDQALKAHALFSRDRDYIVKENQVIIVDQFTGRLMPGRRYSEGLHQAIEAKEGVAVQRESRTVATITFQNYFRKYAKLAGMTGTALTSAEEFFKVYGLEVIAIPTNKPMVRQDLSDQIYRNELAKFRAVAREITEIHKKGQPILVGTVSIEKNEYVSELLKKLGIPHRVLNAKNHEAEAEIIAQAGRKGAVTVATNMAGRGVDIILSGNPPDPDEAAEINGLGGLHVVGTERHEARRIDNQLRGRSGRQGDPGSSQFFVSLEDDLMRVFGGERVKGLMERLNVPEDEPIQSALVSKAIESAQEKIEGYHFDTRKHVLEYDEVINTQRETIYRMRRQIVDPPDNEYLRETVLEMFRSSVDGVIGRHASDNGELEYAEIAEELRRIIPFDDKTFSNVKRTIEAKKTPAELSEYLALSVEKIYQAKEEAVGKEGMRLIEKTVLLRLLDQLWMDHLEEMDYLRSSIGFLAYGQRDPLVEYKKEGRQAFQTLLRTLESEVAQLIFRVGLAKIPEPAAPKNLQFRGAVKDSGETLAIGGQAKLGRNDPCFCGSGKKYKKCGLLDTEEHRRNLAKK